jgi:hypothetical protein
MRAIIYSIAILTIISSCSPRLSVFTYEIYRSGSWSERDLKRVQFYVSNDIVLRRNIGNSSARIESGKIKIIDGTRWEEIIIRAGTPGVLVFAPDNERLAISFESDNRYLMFGPKSKGGEYVLLASKWERDRGLVKYGEETYETPSSSAYAFLQVDARHVNQSSSNRRVAKGRSVRG